MRYRQSYLQPYSTPFSAKLASSSLSKFLRTGKLTNRRYCLHGDVHPAGRPESCFHVEPARFHGEKLVGKRGDLQAWLLWKLAIKTS
jgi:hypothetical protein